MDGENLKGKLKIALICLAVFAVIAIPTAIIANHLIESLEVQVTVTKYYLTISDPDDGTIFSTYTFTGTLMLDSTPLQGYTVTLYIKEGSDFVSTGLTDTTDVDGAYSITWTTDTPGTYMFKTVTQV